MLTAEGCKQRRERLWRKVGSQVQGDYLLFADPIHLVYLANFCVDPFSLGGGFRGYLHLRRDGRATLIYDSRLPHSVDQAHADERVVVQWYDGDSPDHRPRQMALVDAARSLVGSAPVRFHDQPGEAGSMELVSALAELRRRKDPDEVALLRRCMEATDAGHAWARTNIRPGMTELDVYRGVSSTSTGAAGKAVIVYGDFAVSPGPERRGGPPTARVLKPGDLFILDYSVVIGGYRSDFTNTLCVGKEPTADQKRLCDASLSAMAAGERELRAGAKCLSVYNAVRSGFEKWGLADYFPHHAGHGLGLMHPEAPFIVRHADETLVAGDIVTLEPGAYVEGVGGLRIENNYLITETGYEKLSNHTIALR
jgi:Xaa-Pro aminopeptidase